MSQQIDAVQLFKTALTPDERARAFKAYLSLPIHQRNKAMQDVLAPAMDRINQQLGQDNNLSYMAYLLEFVFNKVGELK